MKEGFGPTFVRTFGKLLQVEHRVPSGNSRYLQLGRSSSRCPIISLYINSCFGFIFALVSLSVHKFNMEHLDTLMCLIDLVNHARWPFNVRGRNFKVVHYYPIRQPWYAESWTIRPQRNSSSAHLYKHAWSWSLFTYDCFYILPATMNYFLSQYMFSIYVTICVPK